MLSHIRLAKVPLCLLIWCSTMFGFTLAQNWGWKPMISTGFGVFLLAAGGATLNSLQEYQLDGRMQRTQNRPLVLGQITIAAAAIQAVLLIVCGLTTIFVVSQSFLVVLMGVVAIILYNGIYTPLKTISLWSIFPGALCGAMPPYIGWLSGGGSPLTFIPLLLFSLFILWQIPHFWLVILNHQNDYSVTELPNLLLIFEEGRLKRFFITWIGGLVITMLMFLTQFPYGPVWLTIIISNSLALLLLFTYSSLTRGKRNYRLLFILLNFSILIHMVAVIAGTRLQY